MKTNKSFIQVIKFVAIGILNTAVDYLLFALFFSVCNIDKNISQVFATTVAMTNSYIMNRYFTFNCSGAVKFNEMWKFIIVNLVSMSVTILLLNVFYDWWHVENAANSIIAALGIDFILKGDMAVLFCKLCAVPFSLCVNFLGNKLWVFGSKKSSDE